MATAIFGIFSHCLFQPAAIPFDRSFGSPFVIHPYPSINSTVERCHSEVRGLFCTQYSMFSRTSCFMRLQFIKRVKRFLAYLTNVDSLTTAIATEMVEDFPFCAYALCSQIIESLDLLWCEYTNIICYLHTLFKGEIKQVTASSCKVDRNA